MGESGAELVSCTPPSSPGGRMVRAQAPPTHRGPIKFAQLLRDRRDKLFKQHRRVIRVIERSNSDEELANMSAKTPLNPHHSSPYYSPRHHRKRANTYSVSDTDSMTGSLKCRCSHKQLSRNNSTQSAQSAATIQTLISSSASHKGK